jgi:hypothetical protein
MGQDSRNRTVRADRSAWTKNRADRMARTREQRLGSSDIGEGAGDKIAGAEHLGQDKQDRTA